MQSNPGPRPHSLALLIVVIAGVWGFLVVYSQTASYYGDETFDLLAAQLVAAGKRPYIDFFYQHTPFFTELTAVWMRLFSPTWRSVHVFSTLLTGMAVVLAALYVRVRLTAEKNAAAVAAASATAALAGFQYLVAKYATTAQAYGACLFFAVAAFWLVTVGAAKRQRLAAFGAGICAGAAAAASLLALPVGVVIGVWLLRPEERGTRASSFALFALGAVLASTPLLLLLAVAPRPVLFDAVRYHLSYRSEGWPLQWDLTVLGSGLASAQGIVLMLLAILGLRFAGTRTRLDRELFLCAAIAAAVTIGSAIARPTFEQYFVLAIPFLAIPAGIGASRMFFTIGTQAQAIAAALVMAIPFGLTPARLAHALAVGTEHSWPAIERIANEINRVTPPDGRIWTSAIFYAAAQRIPPSGLETSVRLSLPPADAAQFHVYSESDIAGWAREGRFDTVCLCDRSDQIEELGLRKLFRQHTTLRYPDLSMHSCEIMWDKTAREVPSVSESRK